MHISLAEAENGQGFGNMSAGKSSLYRIKDREERICELAKTYEFISFLDTTDEVKLFRAAKMWYEPLALAQHYEFATPMIDLANDISVAAFFATHKYDGVTRQYRIMKEGTGQIRWVEPDLMKENSPLRPIGVQPYARPSSQYGFGYWIADEEDFADCSQLIRVDQNYEVNARLDAAMLGGENMFFPLEVIAMKAAQIKRCKVITNKAVDAMIADIERGISYIKPAPTRKEIKDVLKEAGVFITDASIVTSEMKSVRGNPVRHERKLVKTPVYKDWVL